MPLQCPSSQDSHDSAAPTIPANAAESNEEIGILLDPVAEWVMSFTIRYEQEIDNNRRDPTRIYLYLIKLNLMYVVLVLQQKGSVGVTINI